MAKSLSISMPWHKLKRKYDKIFMIFYDATEFCCLVIEMVIVVCLQCDFYITLIVGEYY